MPLSQEQHYTIDFIYNLPEGQRAELIDGKIYYQAAPSDTHQKIISKLITQINNYIDSNNGTCEVRPAPYAVYLNADDSVYVEPDISVICDHDKIDEKGCHGAPDWIIEVVSPGNPTHDYITKLSLYKTAGVNEYWIVNPKKQAITVYYFGVIDYLPLSFTFKDKVKVNIYDDLYIDFSKLIGN